MGQIADSINRMLGEVQEQTSTSEAFGRGFAGKMIDNTMGLPDAFASVMANRNLQKVGDVIGQTAGAIRTGDFSQFQRPQAPMEPLSNVDVFPQLTQDDVFGMAQNAGELAGGVRTGNFNEMTPSTIAAQQQGQRTALTQEQHPIASALGQGTGTAAMLLSGKAPSLTAARNARFTPSGGIPDARALVPYQTPGLQRLVTDIFRSKPVQSLGGFAKKAGETGLEGAMVGILEGGDPAEMALYGAGAQGAGSIALALMPTSKGGALKFGATMFGLTALARYGQEFGLGENNWWDALDFTYEKAKYLLLAGGLSGIAGLGRINNSALRDNLPVFAEAITQIPRGTALSFINEYTKDESVQAVADKMVSDPNYFGDTARRRIERALNNEDISISETIDGLLEDDSEFSRRFNSLGQ